MYSQYKIFLQLIIALLCLIWYKKSFIYQKRFSCRKSSPSLSYQFSFHTTLISLCHIVVKACNNNMPSSSIPFCVCFNFLALLNINFLRVICFINKPTIIIIICSKYSINFNFKALRMLTAKLNNHYIDPAIITVTYLTKRKCRNNN